MTLNLDCPICEEERTTQEEDGQVLLVCKCGSRSRMVEEVRPEDWQRPKQDRQMDLLEEMEKEQERWRRGV